MIKEYIIKIDEDQSKKDIHGGYQLIEPPLELVRCRQWINVGVKSFATMGDWFCADGEKR